MQERSPDRDCSRRFAGTLPYDLRSRRHREESLADVFLSYVRSDYPVAAEMARVLEASGLSVWWDHHIRAGTDFSAEIERQIGEARAVIVLWSAAAHDSPWVRDEAAYARDRKKLIPVALDGAEPPLGFRQIQTLAIATSNGAANARALTELVATVQRLIDPASRVEKSGIVSPVMRSAKRRWWPAILAVAGAALVLFLTRESWLPGGPTREIPQKSIAVMPFIDMSERKDQEFLADGIADEVLNMLAKAPDLFVSARTSSFSFKGKPTTIPEIARALGVAHVLEGSIRRAGDRLRITVQLLHADTGYHLWSETYDRELRDVFEMQNDIATAVAQALQIKLEGGELSRRKGGTQNLEAYQLYLQAELDANVASRESLERAQAQFERAIELDPNYGLALAWLANVVAMKAEFGIDTAANYQRASELAMSAMQLSPDTTLPYIVLQVIHKNVDHDWTAWGQVAKRALAIDPTDPPALQIAALLSRTLGRWNEAERQLRAALKREPLDQYVHWNLGATYLGAGRLQESEDVLRNLLEMSPEFPWTYPYLARTLMAQGKLEEALEVLQKAPDESIRLSMLPAVLDKLGRKAEADEALEAQIAAWGDSNAYCVAGTYAHRGDHVTALQWLERAYVQHDSGLNEILGEPVFRQAPYREFLRKMKLAEYL